MQLEEVIEILVNNFNPYSIFLYGSKATDSCNSKSDYVFLKMINMFQEAIY